MTRREIVHALAGATAGAVVASGVWSVQKPEPARVRAEPGSDAAAGDDIESLRAANANLVESLQQADKTIAQLREQLGPAPSPPASGGPPPGDRPFDGDAGFRRRSRGEPTKEDWERMAQLGTVRMRVPCLRDRPWTPPARVLDRLGLAPSDAETIRQAYEHSNKRMADQIKPLCAKVLGSSEAADRVGPKACSDAILSGGRRSDPEGTQKSVVKLAEVNAGKSDAKPSDSAVEQLLFAMTNETKAFEAELASKLGPDEAKRLAWAPEMCADRMIVRGSDREDTDDSDMPRARRGR